MKKIILSVAAVLVFGFTNAQEKKELENSSAIKFGVKVGANYDWLGTGALSVYNLRPEVGYHGGVLVEFKMCNKFAVQTEALYSFHSFNFNGNGKPSRKLEISEVAVPVLGKFYLTKALSLEAGPQASLILTAKNAGKDIKDDIREFNVAAVSGLAYDFNKSLFVQVRYVYNLLDLQNGPKGNNLYSIQTSIGYKF